MQPAKVEEMLSVVGLLDVGPDLTDTDGLMVRSMADGLSGNVNIFNGNELNKYKFLSGDIL